MKKRLKILTIFLAFLAGICLVIAIFCIFYDEAVFVRSGTIYRAGATGKVVALTFDDGPSEWTPKILDALKKSDVKATFFMLGKHVEKYPNIARRVALEGHDIGNHTYDHHVLTHYRMDNLTKEIKSAEAIIRDATGKTTVYFRPPKAWLTASEKQRIKELGYKIILWTLNSKDWVTFDDKYMVRYLSKNVKPGDIILFHDGGGVFSVEGGNREETVKAIPKLVEKLKEKGYRFLTITELLNLEKDAKQD